MQRGAPIPSHNSKKPLPFNPDDPSIRQETLMMIVQYLEENGFRSSAMILKNEARFDSADDSPKSTDIGALRNAVVGDEWTTIEMIQNDKSLPPRLVYCLLRHHFIHLLLSGDSYTALQFLSSRLRPYKAFEDQPGDFDKLCFLLVDAASPSRAAPLPDLEESLQRTLAEIDTNFVPSNAPTAEYSMMQGRLRHLIQQAAAYQMTQFPLGCVDTIIHDFVPAMLPAPSIRKMMGGHNGNIKSVAFVPKTKLLVSGGSDSNINVWNIENCTSMAKLSGHKGRIWSIATTDQLIVTGSGDGTVKLWDLEHFSNISTLTGHNDDVYTVDIDENSNKIISGGFDRSIIVHDVGTGVPINTIKGPNGSITSLCFDSTGNMIISGGKDLKIQIWDLRNCISVLSLDPVLGEVSSVCADRSFERVLAATKNSSNRIWDLRMTGSSLLLKGHQNLSKHFVRARFGPENRTALSGSDDGKIYCWDTSSGILVEKFDAHPGGSFDIAYSDELRLFASCGENNVVRIWEQKQMK